MSLPYFASGKDPHERKIEEGLIQLLLPDIQELIGHLLKKPLSDIPKASLASIVNGYYFSQSQILSIEPSREEPIKGDIVWGKIIEVIFELGNLVESLRSINDLYILYECIMGGVFESQQDLHYSKKQIEALEDNDLDTEVIFKEYIDKYKTLYEGLDKKTISFPIYCLDVVSENEDAESKDELSYIRDDLSYKNGNISDASGLGLQNDIEELATGVDEHIRNSIAHNRYEYSDGGRVNFKDRNFSGEVIFEKTFSLSTFKLFTKELEVNFWAQATALLLFIHEHSEKISVRSEGFSKPKQVRLAVYSACVEVMLTPIDIHINDGLLTCEVQRDNSVNYPSTVVTNRRGVRTQQTRPPISLRDQLLEVAVRLAETGISVSIADLQAEDHEGNHLGRIQINIGGLSSAMEAPPYPPIETFILESDLEEDEEPKSED